MVPQAAILVGVGLFGIFFAVAAYHAWEQQQQRPHRCREEPLPQRPSTPRPVVLGSCGFCGWVVLNESYRLPCNHHSHPTCGADIKTLSRGDPTFNWADVCRNCVKSRVKKDASTRVQKNEGPVVLGSCGFCGRDVLNESYRLPCNHHSHPTCGADIKTLLRGHPTFNWADVCRNCVKARVKKDASTRVQKNEGLRNRGTNRQICADCRQPFVDTCETQQLDCKHRVHKTCWDEIVTSGFTTCSLCMNEE